MDITNIGVGTTPNDGTGDTLRSAMGTINANFDEVEAVRDRDRKYPIDELLPNGDFTLWTARPATGSIQTSGSGAGFTVGDICDGWYGGPGTSAQYTFTNPLDDAATGGRIGKFVWDASVAAGETHHAVVGQITAGYWRFSFLEWLLRLDPGHALGTAITIEFDAKASASYTIVPIVALSMGNSAWAANTAYDLGDIVMGDPGAGEFAGNRTYECVTAGTSAGSGGPTGTGSGIADNTAVWDYVGEEMGREFELYEAGASASAQQIAWGDPVASARCAVTTSWQTFRKQIFIPELDTGSGSEYGGQANDSGARTFTEPAGLGAYLGVAFDIWHNSAIGPTIEFRNVRAWIGTETHTEQVKIPRDLKMLMSNGFARMADLYRPYASQAQQEAATSTAVSVTPGRQQYHPSAAKFWVKWTTTGTTILSSYNVTSVTNTGTGNETITIANDFSSADWVPFGMANTSNTGDGTASVHPAFGTMAAGALQVMLTNGANPEAFVDGTIGVGGFGDL